MKTKTTYDVVPYSSYPYPNTHPERLYTIGKLFGMQPVNFKKCKVLELGCASGGNIIPFATMFPESIFVGIDISDAQVKQGQKHIEGLGLSNITLKTMSITDINAKLGKFDYIIVHGVLSWVPKDIQDKIFSVFAKNLAKNGIAYVSYNSLPGWNSIKTIRDMMLFHTRDFEKSEDKIREARLLLKFIKEANPGSKTAYMQTINDEIELLESSEDAHILYDHMGEYNEPFYFHQIAQKANENKLQYLGDTSIASMFPGNFPQGITETLSKASGDVIKTEQYIDFIRNRRFRTSLFCHQDIELNRSLEPKCLEDFYILAQISTNEDLSKIDLTSRKEIAVEFRGNVKFASANPAVIIALRILIEQKGKPIATKELLNKVSEISGPAANQAVIQKVILEQFLRLVLADAISIYSYPGKFITEITEKPKASELARYQAANNTWITNQKAERRNVDLFNRLLLGHLDGNNNFADILEKMLKHVENNELVININGKKAVDSNQLREVLRVMIKENIGNLVPNAVLVG